MVTNACLTVFNFFSVRHYEKRFNAQDWIWTSAELNIQWLLFFFFIYNSTCISSYNRIGGVMVNMLASSAVHRGFETRSGQTKDYKIGICCFSAKDRLVQNQNNVSEWSNMSTSGLLFQ